MRICITGGAGFIGTHTANALVTLGHEVTVYDNLLAQIHGSKASFPKSLDPKIRKIKGDIRDKRALQEAITDQDIIYHFASLTGVGQSMYEVNEYVDVNVRGTATLMEAIVGLKQKPTKVILSSSRAVYGEGRYKCKNNCDCLNHYRPDLQLSNNVFDMLCPICGETMQEVPIAESQTLKPLSIYAETKKHQEDYLKYLAKYYKVPVTILRYFNVYGSHQSLNNPYTGILTVFYRQIQNGQPISIYEQGRPTRDFVHIRDVVQANLCALKYTHDETEIFNIGTGEQHAIRTAAELLTNACNKIVAIKETNLYRAGDILACTADLRASREKLNYTPRVSLNDGIQEFVKWANQQTISQTDDNCLAELQKHQLIGNALCTTV